MSFDAIRWALAQPVGKSSAKFVLVAMADCVNPDTGADWLAWPSYRHLADRTAQDVKTVEAGVKRLRDDGYIMDTGERQGRTGGVVVYRLNTTKNGVALRSPEPRITPETAIASTPKNGVATEQSNPASGATTCAASDPVFPRSDPVFPSERPQFSLQATPKTGYGSSNGSSKRSSKEAGKSAPITSIPGVPESLLADWMAVRKDKRAGTLTQTAVEGLVREAAKAGVSVEVAVRFCIESNWVGFNAGWYADRVTSRRSTTASRHSGFRDRDYSEGASDGIPDA